MITIQKSHHGHPTYLIGNYMIINNCVPVNLEDIDSYGSDYKVSDDHYNEIKRALAKHNSQEDWGSLAQHLVHHEIIAIRKAVAEQGYGLDTLINDEDSFITLDSISQNDAIISIEILESK